MAKAALERVNLILEKSKLRRLRRVNGARSNSEAVRLAIDRGLATTMGITALKKLRELRAIEDVFTLAPKNRT